MVEERAPKQKLRKCGQVRARSSDSSSSSSCRVRGCREGPICFSQAFKTLSAHWTRPTRRMRTEALCLPGRFYGCFSCSGSSMLDERFLRSLAISPLCFARRPVGARPDGGEPRAASIARSCCRRHWFGEVARGVELGRICPRPGRVVTALFTRDE